ncbi:MAG: hypothetical protein LR015_02480 [Verrucomicrobia bacterium]|nr:hypothetical protein [Verrucomicrobiota bacterium]
MLSVAVVFADNKPNAEQDYGNLVITVPIAGELQADNVKRLIVATVVGREWRVVSSEDNKVVANLVHRRYDSTLTFIYTDSVIRVYSYSYQIDRNQRRLRRDDPKGWIRNIERDLHRRMAELIHGL